MSCRNYLLATGVLPCGPRIPYTWISWIVGNNGQDVLAIDFNIIYHKQKDSEE